MQLERIQRIERMDWSRDGVVGLGHDRDQETQIRNHVQQQQMQQQRQLRAQRQEQSNSRYRGSNMSQRSSAAEFVAEMKVTSAQRITRSQVSLHSSIATQHCSLS